MELAKQIAEEQERSGVAYSDDLCACFDIGEAEIIIAAKLEPIRNTIEYVLSEEEWQMGKVSIDFLEEILKMLRVE